MSSNPSKLSDYGSTGQASLNVVDADQDDGGRPDDCMCSEVSQRLGTPCFPCYRDGFETPAEVSD